jgi:hypothetical protein
MIGPGLYAGILVFQIFMTFYIGEYNLGWVDIIIVALPVVLLWAITHIKIAMADTRACLEAHIRDFPDATRPASDIARAVSVRRGP